MRILLTFFSATLLTVSRAYTGKVLWYWFAVPLGVRPIGFWHMMGLVTLSWVFTGTFVKTHKEAGAEKTTRERVSEDLAAALLLPVLLLGFGWLYLQAMR
jgi:hypothetical protein